MASTQKKKTSGQTAAKKKATGVAKKKAAKKSSSGKSAKKSLSTRSSAKPGSKKSAKPAGSASTATTKKTPKKSPNQSSVAESVARSAPTRARTTANSGAPATPSYLKVFPKDFLWGTATCATQIDGGDMHSDWAHFSQKPGNIADGKDCLVACDHWNRFEEDFKLMKSLGLNAYRLGVDWSRMEPRPGERNHAALNHFRSMLDSLNKKGIRPLLTMNHFAIPQWWLEKGGWVKEENLASFMDFVAYIVENTGDLVYEYTTINEPNVYAMFSYMEGIWPPAKGGLTGYLRSMKVLRNMALAQGKMYDLIHETHGRKGFATPQVGMAKHVRVFDPARPDNRLDRDRAKDAEYRFNYMWTDSIHDGHLQGSLGKNEKFHDGPCWDFVGLNYYTRDKIRFSPTAFARLFIDREEVEGAPTNDLGWEIYPEGMHRLVHDFFERYKLPIRITENGIADASDTKREHFLISHVQQIARCLEEGVPVEGYYHWSFLDNFEWAEGYTARFGLVEVDFNSQKRTPRKSADAYKKMIARARKSGR
tara:strand:+ start:36474 stop:38078 length:1605 start_codon:yes stop_codon:yes gene_type:complete